MHTTSESPSQRIWYADRLCVGGGALISIALMTHHPVAQGEDFAARLASLDRIAVLSAWVHGGLIAVLFLIVIGLITLIEWFPRSWRLPRSAWILFASGALALSAAATLSGWVVPRLAQTYLERSAAEQQTLRATLSFAHQLNQILAQMGSLACALSIGMFSLALWFRRRGGLALAWAGMAYACAASLALLSGHLVLHVHGMTLIVLLQALWLVALALQWRSLSRLQPS